MARAAGKSPLLIVAFTVIHLCLVPVMGYVVVEESSSPLSMRRLKATHLHFFLQDFVTGDNATAVKVAGVANGTTSPFMFGDVYVIDDRLTQGVDPSSPVVGNAQGIYAFTGMNRSSIYMAADFGFTTGKYNGSSISVASRNPISETVRELAVVGGRGRFRLAQGFVVASTRYWRGLDAIVEYNATVLHY
ncbi:hypothetical protein Taro_054957 [Colocasia esculenta]|uniref:Dirigent protein n=1 Tax=Colocasia esculenta TaxID=4460 RepID=A0A843XS76_COLES|nr:hypothetical protein [Colocasia esculenta]